MAKTADKFILAVSPLTGDAFITTIDKKGLMTDNRRKLDRDEVLSFIYQWSQEEAEKLGSDTIYITAEGKRVLEIKVLEKEL